MKISIVGAGISGLTFAANAAHDGHTVTVFDPNPSPGGVMALTEKDGYRFEQGPMILGDLLPGEAAYNMLKSLGIYIETVRADRGVVMPDYEMWKPDEYAGPHWRADRLKKLFPKEKKGIDEYYRIYESMMALRYLSGLPQTPFVKLRMALVYSRVRKYEKLTADGLMKRLFNDEKLRALFIGILADVCADPEEFQGLGLPFCNTETSFDKRIPLEKNGKQYYPGSCYIVGGCQKLPEALAEYISSHDGEIRLNTVVEKVIVENGRVTGVREKNGKLTDADVVVGSGSALDFFTDLVGLENLDGEYRKILETFRPMEAVFMLHLGVDYDPLQFMKAPLCYYYCSYDLHEAVRKLRSGVYHGGDEGFLIFVPSAHAPDFAPPGKYCVTIYTVAPDALREGTWSEKKEEYAKKLIEKAEKRLPDLSRHITAMKIMTAEDYRLFMHMKKSAFGGVVPIWGQKNPPHVTNIGGLYFVGQQSENAGCVGTVMLGAQSAYEKMKEREKV